MSQPRKLPSEDYNEIPTHYRPIKKERLPIDEQGNPIVAPSDFKTRYLRRKEETDDTEAVGDTLPKLLLFVLPDGQTISAPIEREVLIGRRPRPEDPEVTVDLNVYKGHQHGVSRVHCMIAIKHQTLTVRDLGSVNGTQLNGYTLAAAQSYPLRHCDVLTLGQLPLKVIYVD
jgi:hypothetical protein